MCGILGFLTDKPSVDNAKFFRRLLLLSESRGAEATGIAYAKNENIVIDKAPVSASTFLKENMTKHTPYLEKTHLAIGHTRYPTIGTPKDNNNNHPIETPNWIVVHNGSVTQMPRLGEYNYKGTVDSEILASYIESYGLEKGLPYVEKGTAAVAVINKADTTSLFLWRETNPIIVAYNEATKTIFFASQKEFLERALINLIGFFSTFVIRELPANVLYHVTTNPVNMKYVSLVEVMRWNPNRFHKVVNLKDEKKGKEMKFNPLTKRYELPEEDKDKEGNNKEENKDVKMKENEKVKSGEQGDRFLQQMGFTPIEIKRMTDHTKITIMYNDYNPEDIWIDAAGEIHHYINSEPRYLPTAAATTSNTPEVKVDVIPSTRYYLDGMSHDFHSWIRLDKPHKGHISVDGLLLKRYDSQKNAHFIITVADAIVEGLIDKEAIENSAINDLEDAFKDNQNMESCG